MTFKSIIEAIKMIPQIWAIYLQIVKLFEKRKLEKKKKDLADNIQKIEEAKTDEEIKDSFRDMFK